MRVRTWLATRASCVDSQTQPHRKRTFHLTKEWSLYRFTKLSNQSKKSLWDTKGKTDGRLKSIKALDGTNAVLWDIQLTESGLYHHDAKVQVLVSWTLWKNCGDQTQNCFESHRGTADTFSTVLCRTWTATTKTRRSCSTEESWRRQACYNTNCLPHRVCTQESRRNPFLRLLSPTECCQYTR